MASRGRRPRRGAKLVWLLRMAVAGSALVLLLAGSATEARGSGGHGGSAMGGGGHAGAMVRGGPRAGGWSRGNVGGAAPRHGGAFPRHRGAFPFRRHFFLRRFFFPFSLGFFLDYPLFAPYYVAYYWFYPYAPYYPYYPSYDDDAQPRKKPYYWGDWKLDDAFH